jgi:flagellar biosynthesis GTPase FlhF
MANTAEFLSIHGEILNVPVERVWAPGPWQEPVQFIDFPGIAVNETEAIAAMAVQIDELQPAEVYLVLNAAYDLTHLMAHIRAFRGLPLTGLILSHVDEENRWSKFWNLLLSSSLPVLYFSGGQNIPGHFAPAFPQSLFDVTTEPSVTESRGISR